MASWTLTLAGYLPPTTNVLLRSHWSVTRRVVREDGLLIASLAASQGVPKAAGRRRVSLLFRQPRGPLADADNRLKACLDSLVKAGMLVDDCPAYLDLAGVRSERGPRGTVVTLEDVT